LIAAAAGRKIDYPPSAPKYRGVRYASTLMLLLLTALALEPAALAGRKRPRRDLWPPMKLEHVNTHEKLTVRVYDRRGRNQRSSLRKLRRFLRCHQTGTSRVIHWRLIRNLYKIWRHFKGKTIKVYSGYRNRRVARLKGSRHIRGRAIDFRVAGVGKRTLRDYLRHSFKNCGVGYYPNAPFVHFDVRDRRAFWVDVSGRGEDTSYVDAYAFLKQERKQAQAAKKQANANNASKSKKIPKSSPPVTGPPPLGPSPLRVGHGATPEGGARPPAPRTAAATVSNSGGGRGGSRPVLAE
jgi:uncharacterized protein YcbK (DUF882 family)